MNKQEFKNFVDKNKLESHWMTEEIILIVPSYLILEFQKILCLDAKKGKTLECQIGKDYFVFDIYNFLENEGLSFKEMENIFPNLDNNI